MVTNLKWSSYNTPDTAIAGADLNGLTNGSYKLGAEIDNSTDGYTIADLLIGLSSSITSGSGNPAVSIWIMPAIDGTNYPTPPGGSGGATFTNLFQGSILIPASTTTQYLPYTGLFIPPCKFKIMIRNDTGVSFPATNTSTCTLSRYRGQAS
jgi:hypothetical protein